MSTPSLLSTIGEEIVRIIAPVSACMLLVVLLVTSLSSPSLYPSSSSPSSSSSSSSSSFWNNLEPALLISLAFVAAATLLTFLLLLLFYFRFTSCLKSYIALSSFAVLTLVGGQVSLALTTTFSISIDIITFSILLLNLGALGVAAVPASPRGFPIVVTQGVLVAIAVLVAYWFTMLPEWTTWALLVAMAVYDLAAVLLPVGPLRLLVELAMSRDEELPALVYEARPVECPEGGGGRRRVWREQPVPSLSAGREGSDLEVSLLVEEEGRAENRGTVNVGVEEDGVERIGLGASGAIKLGLGDFIFYSVLVGRAAMYDYMTVYACYLAIIAGLGITLLLLAFYQTALPALPVSIALGVLFYFVTRALLEVFVVQCSVNLVMF